MMEGTLPKRVTLNKVCFMIENGSCKIPASIYVYKCFAV